MMGLQKDSERLEAINVSLIQADHPCCIFASGNKKSLLKDTKRAGIDILSELRKFYDQYYSANLMTLCVQSTLSLDEMEKMVGVFEKIPNMSIPRPTLEALPRPVNKCNFLK
eukprot:sb/3477075/